MPWPKTSNFPCSLNGLLLILRKFPEFRPNLLLPDFALAHGSSPKLAACQELVARLHGYPNWQAALEVPSAPAEVARPRSNGMVGRTRKAPSGSKRRRGFVDPEFVHLNLQTCATYPHPDNSPAWNYEGQILGIVGDDDDASQIGHVHAYVLDLWCETHDISEVIFDDAEAFLPLFDFDSDRLLSDAATEASGGDFGMVMTLVIIDWIELEKGFRGSHLGLLATKLLMDALAEDVYALVAISLTSGYQRDRVPTDNERGVDQLARYFSKLGFERVAGTDLLVLSTSLQHPKITDCADWCRPRTPT